MDQTSNRLLDDYYTREQLAAELGKSVRTLDRMRAQRRGPPFCLVAGTILYRRAAVAEWLIEQEKKFDPPTSKRGR